MLLALYAGVYVQFAAQLAGFPFDVDPVAYIHPQLPSVYPVWFTVVAVASPWNIF